MRSYKQWTKEDRQTSANLCRRAIELNWLRPRIACERCRQEEGILHMHNEDYGVTLDILPKIYARPGPLYITTEEKIAINECMEVMCWRCHMIHHSSHRAAASCAEYWISIARGKIWPPVYKHDFSILARDHKIY